MPPFCEGGAVLASNFEIVVDFDLICPIYIIKYQKVNKHPKFDDNFDIWCQSEHFEKYMKKTYIYKNMPQASFQNLLEFILLSKIFAYLLS